MPVLLKDRMLPPRLLEPLPPPQDHVIKLVSIWPMDLPGSQWPQHLASLSFDTTSRLDFALEEWKGKQGAT